MEEKLGPEIDTIRETARRFAADKVSPRASELDATGEFPYDLVAEMGQLGFFGMLMPEEYGGSGLGHLGYSAVLEEVAYGECGVAINITAQTLTAACIASYANEEIRGAWLPPMMRGEVLGAFALTEPEAGSDAGALRTQARREGGDWIIDGSKMLITNGGTDISKLIVLLARTESGTSMFFVPLDAPGVEIGKPYRKMGWRCSNTVPISFSSVRIPAANLMGEEGKGLKGMLAMLNGARIGIASNSVGMARCCLDISVEHAQGRKQFGRALGDFQVTQFKLAEMATNLELARLITHKAARLADAGLPCATEASMAKMFASRSVKTAADEAVQIAGGQGFLEEHTASRIWRTVKVLEIGEGTNEIQHMLIARSLGFKN